MIVAISNDPVVSKETIFLFINKDDNDEDAKWW